MLQKVKFFNKKWQVEGRPDFPLILPVKSDRFFTCKSGSIHESSLIWALKKIYSFCLSWVQKTFFIIKRDDVTNGRRTVVLLRAVEVSMG